MSDEIAEAEEFKKEIDYVIDLLKDSHVIDENSEAEIRKQTSYLFYIIHDAIKSYEKQEKGKEFMIGALIIIFSVILANTYFDKKNIKIILNLIKLLATSINESLM
jgi:hypothetical protein